MSSSFLNSTSFETNEKKLIVITKKKAIKKSSTPCTFAKASPNFKLNLSFFNKGTTLGPMG